ncbi:MAG: riboflavin synthase, partial [Acholeplasmataceae bacterium]|nr:riboflavin synthase [Acholeplasmataceae bacterium]
YYSIDLYTQGGILMFTGIIEEIGIVKSIKKGPKSAVLTISASKVLKDTKLGDSISTSGVCLSVTKMDEQSFTVDVMNETLNRTTIQRLTPGSRVNLERAMQVGDRFGGHIVSGHIDGVGTISSITKLDIARLIYIQANSDILKYIIDQGSIAIDGISLTVVKVDQYGFSVSIIPLTQKDTTLLDKRVGEAVNLECDVISKYVEKLLGSTNQKGITLESLKKYGF